MVPIKMSIQHSCSTILYRLATIHNAIDTHQTDRHSDYAAYTLAIKMSMAFSYSHTVKYALMATKHVFNTVYISIEQYRFTFNLFNMHAAAS